MRPFTRRLLGYGSSAVVVLGLCYLGFVYEPAPDPNHLLLQAEIKLRFAARIADRQPDGRSDAGRDAMVADALAYLDQVDALDADSVVAQEYRGYALWLNGDARGAAACYSLARTRSRERDQQQALLVCEARMLSLAGDDRGAADLLQTADRSGVSGGAVQLELARIAARAGDATRARRCGEDVVANQAASDVDLLAAGELLEELGALVAAESAFVRAAENLPIAGYFAARLKVKVGEVDNALGMLERAVHDAGDSVRGLVRRDASVWRACEGAERFRKLVPELEVAMPGH